MQVAIALVALQIRKDAILAGLCYGQTIVHVRIAVVAWQISIDAILAGLSHG